MHRRVLQSANVSELGRRQPARGDGPLHDQRQLLSEQLSGAIQLGGSSGPTNWADQLGDACHQLGLGVVRHYEHLRPLQQRRQLPHGEELFGGRYDPRQVPVRSFACTSEAWHACQKLGMHVRSSPRRSPFPHRYPTETHRPTGTPASVMPYTHSRCNVNLLRPPSAPPLPPLIPMPQRPPSGPKLPPSPPMPPMWPPFDETYNPLEKHR